MNTKTPGPADTLTTPDQDVQLPKHAPYAVSVSLLDTHSALGAAIHLKRINELLFLCLLLMTGTANVLKWCKLVRGPLLTGALERPPHEASTLERMNDA